MLIDADTFRFWLMRKFFKSGSSGISPRLFVDISLNFSEIPDMSTTKMLISKIHIVFFFNKFNNLTELVHVKLPYERR